MALDRVFPNPPRPIFCNLVVTAVQVPIAYHAVAPLLGLTPISAATYSLVFGVTYALFPRASCQSSNWMVVAKLVASAALGWFATAFVGSTWTFRELLLFTGVKLSITVGLVVAAVGMAGVVLATASIVDKILKSIKGAAAGQPLTA